MKTEMCYIYTLLEVIKFVSSLLNVILVINCPSPGGVLSSKNEIFIKSYENNNI